MVEDGSAGSEQWQHKRRSQNDKSESSWLVGIQIKDNPTLVKWALKNYRKIGWSSLPRIEDLF